MGRGNVSAGHNGRLFYVDYDYFNMYYRKDDPEEDSISASEYYDLTEEKQKNYEYDETLSQIYYDDFKEELTERILKRYKSFNPSNRHIGRYKHIELSNKLFHIVLEDNEWSVAVEILPNESGKPGFQKRQLDQVAKGVRNILLDMFPTIHTRNGPWLSNELTREDAKRLDQEEKERVQKEKTENTEGTMNEPRG